MHPDLNRRGDAGRRDSVIMVEDTEREGNEVKVFKSITPAQISGRWRGYQRRSSNIKAGIMLDAGKVGVIACRAV